MRQNWLQAAAADRELARRSGSARAAEAAAAAARREAERLRARAGMAGEDAEVPVPHAASVPYDSCINSIGDTGADGGGVWSSLSPTISGMWVIVQRWRL